VIESCSFQIGIERDISQESHFDAMIHGQQMNYATATYSTSGSIYETVRIRYSVQDQPPAGLMEMVQAQQQTGTLKQSETLKRSSSMYVSMLTMLVYINRIRKRSKINIFMHIYK
jgi:hypothetical protein